MGEILGMVSILFMPPLPSENTGCKSQCTVREHSGAVFNRCNTANAIFRGQAGGLVTVVTHFCAAGRSFRPVKKRPSSRGRQKNSYQRGGE